MPTYEYACEKCGHEFEVLQSMSAKPLRICPEDLCGRKKWGRGKVKRKISTGGGLLFKGSGFYITDYRSEKYKDAAKKDTGGGGETKTTAKPEAPKPAPAKKTEKK